MRADVTGSLRLGAGRSQVQILSPRSRKSPANRPVSSGRGGTRTGDTRGTNSTGIGAVEAHSLALARGLQAPVRGGGAHTVRCTRSATGRSQVGALGDRAADAKPAFVVHRALEYKVRHRDVPHLHLRAGDRPKHEDVGQAREQFEDERDSEPARVRAFVPLPNGAEPLGEGSDDADDEEHRRDRGCQGRAEVPWPRWVRGGMRVAVAQFWGLQGPQAAWTHASTKADGSTRVILRGRSSSSRNASGSVRTGAGRSSASRARSSWRLTVPPPQMTHPSPNPVGSGLSGDSGASRVCPSFGRGVGLRIG